MLYLTTVFDEQDMLGARNSSQIDDFYTRGQHENLGVYYINQSYFGLPKQSIRNNCNRLILLKQTLGDNQSIYFDIGAYGMKSDEFKEMCREAWVKKLTIYGLISLKKMKVFVVFPMQAKTHILNAFPNMKLVKKINVVSN